MKSELQKSFVSIHPWELGLIKKVAQAFRTEDREELIAHLAWKLVRLKARPPLNIQNWKAYLAKFLYNKAANWVRDDRARIGREHLKCDEGKEPSSSKNLAVDEEQSRDLAIAVAAVWVKLDPALRTFWLTLLQERGNRSATARRLGIHRNTVRLKIARIAGILRQHGLQMTRP